MVAAAWKGYFPEAVSSESITASVPSSMALNTSLASARVGSGSSTIVLNICVAVITGFPRRLHSLMRRFWKPGTLCGPI